MSERKLIKITFEYDNGVIEYLRDEQARDWYRKIGGQLALGFVHGEHPNLPKFEKGWSWRKLLPSNWGEEEVEAANRTRDDKRIF